MSHGHYANDEEWAAACAAGDRRAQRMLYERFRLPLYRLCLRYARDAQEAEDFLHDGLLRVFRDLAQYRGQGALGGWVRRVVLNTVLQHLRRRPQLLPATELPDPGIAPEPEPGYLDGFPAERIYALIRELPPGYRTVFSLFYLEGWSHEQIARELEISEGASKSQLYKAKRQLRKLVNTARTKGKMRI